MRTAGSDMRLQEPARDQGGGDGSEPMPERCRLLLALPYLGPGGAQRVLVSIMRGLDQRRFEVRLVVPNRVGDVYSHLIPPQVELIDLRKRRVRDALPALLR